jgi:hypothetical protein
MNIYHEIFIILQRTHNSVSLAKMKTTTTVLYWEQCEAGFDFYTLHAVQNTKRNPPK